MNFKEKQLVEILEKILKKQFGTNVAFRELSAGYGIADLVFAENFSFTKRNVTSRPSITNYTDLQLFLNMVQGRKYALGDLSENSEYDQAREDQANLEKRIIEIEYTLEHAEIIDKIVKAL